MSDSGNTPHLYGGRYAIESKIARGGMADVFLARDQLLDRPVALKVLFAELSVDPSFVERFRREAQNAARLSHPNIVSVYDWGEDGNAYFIVMEYVTGRTLSTMLRDDGPLPVNRAALIGAEVASALSFAHKNGVVHRDVKPGNVLIDDRGLVKVTDFGIARARNTTENLTQTGAVMGTATYFSPEQAQGFSVDQRSDVYSLGVVLYEMVAGKPPFHGDNPVTIAYKHVREDPQPLQVAAPGVPAGYAAITAKSLAKAPSDRYASAEDLRADLNRFSNNQPVHALRSPPAAHSTPRAAAAYADATRAVPTVRTTVPQSSPPRRKSAWGPFLVLISLLAALAIGAVIFLNWGGGDDDSPVTVPTVTGKTKAEAERILEEAELRWTERPQADSAEKDMVIGQNPQGEAQARKNDIVQLIISAGPEPISIDNYTNQSEAAARNALTKAGLKVQTTQASSETVQQGNVISQQPSPGEQVTKGDTVTLTISTGPQKVAVPNVIGFTIATASQTLSDFGLRTSFPEGTDPSDLVASTDPDANTEVAKGTTIVLTPAASKTTTTTTSRNSTTTTTTEPD
jgi:serine/threonine protein kinase/beta-lactam-binding protein with PASTA domain